MNLKIKKRVISMLCATVMGASSMGASVGAIQVPYFPKSFQDAVLKLNQTLECSTDGLTQLKDNIQKLKLKLNNQHDDAVENIIAELSEVINKINNWDNYYITSEDVVVEIQEEITNLNDQITQLNSKCLSEELNLVIQNSTAICNKIETINNKLLEENRKSLFKNVLQYVEDDNDNNDNNDNYVNLNDIPLSRSHFWDGSSDDNNNNNNNDNNDNNNSMI